MEPNPIQTPKTMKNIPSLALSSAIAAQLFALTATAATYYWDDNAAGLDFGTAGASTGTWTGTTAGPTAGWSLSGTGVDAFAPFTTDLADVLNFGNGAVGLGAGTIAVSGTVNAGNMTFASGSGAILLSGGTIHLASAETITVDNAGNTINSILSGAATSLTKAGTGTLTLSGNNDYTGPTVISNGILTISHNNALGSTAGNTTIAATGSNNGPRLTLGGGITSAENISISGTTETGNYSSVITNTSGTNTLGGNITLASPSGGIRIGSGAGELIFSGTISQTGTNRALVLQASTGAALTVNNAIGNNNGPLTVINPGAVTLKGASTAIGATTIAEGGFLRIGVTNAIKTDQNLTIGSPWNFTGSDQGTFDLAGFNQTVNALIGTKNTTVGTIGSDSTRIVTNSATGTSTLTVGNGNGTGTFNGVINDGGAGKIVALTKTGTGTLTLVGDSNYSGVTTISAGTVSISHANALGSTTGNTTIATNGNVMRLNLIGNITTAENITITGATEASGFNPVISGAGTLSGTITLSGLTNGIRMGGVTFSGTIQQIGSSQFLALAGTTVNNAINNNGGDLQINVGTSTLKGVSGSGIGNTRLVQNGVLVLGISNALNTTANLTLGAFGATDNGTFSLNGFNQTINILNTGGAGSGTRIVRNNHASAASTLTVGNGGGSGTYDGTIVNGAAGTLAITKTGAGTQTLSGANTYTGATTVNEGRLIMTNQGATNSSAYSVAGGATLEMAVATGTRTMATNSSLSGTGSFVKSGGGTLVWAGASATWNFGAGALIDVQGGQITAGSNANDVWTNNKADLNVAAGATFDAAEGSSLANGGVFVDALSGAGTIKVGYTAGGPYGNMITFGVDNGSGTFDGVLANSTTAGNYTKAGNGTQILSGANTYTGNTTVNAGVLAVNGSLANTATTVASATSARLQGSGLIVGPMTIGDKGTLAPGNSIESLGVGALTFNVNSTFDFEIQTDLFAGSPNESADLVYSTGALNIAPGALLTLSELGTSTALAAGSKFTLVSYTGSAPADVFTHDGSPLADGDIKTIGANTWQFNYADTSGGPNFAADQSGANNFFTMTVVPEAGTAGLVALGLLLVRWLRLRTARA